MAFTRGRIILLGLSMFVIECLSVWLALSLVLIVPVASYVSCCVGVNDKNATGETNGNQHRRARARRDVPGLLEPHAVRNVQ